MHALFCPHCGVHALIVDGDRRLFDAHVRRHSRRR